MTYHQITLEERYHLQALRGVAPSLAAIARALGRHRSTISRELRRNRTRSGPYRPYPADCYARTRRSHSRRNQRLTPADWQQVVTGLGQGWSPEQIAGRGRRDGTLRISHETIYRYVWADFRMGGTLHRLLRGARKRRRRRGGSWRRRGQRLGRPLTDRPAHVATRRRLGHWEIDTVAGGRGPDCLLSLVERKSGYLLLGKLADHSARTFTARSLTLLAGDRHRVYTITADNGSELVGYRRIERGTGARFYFAAPYHAWERGTNENTNGLIRQYAPKGTSLAGLTQRDCSRIARQLNTRPRKRLGYRTPEECYEP
jgi:IS30 family transposase